MTTPIPVLAPEDPYGRSSITGMKSLLPDRRLRRLSHAKNTSYHLTPNGIYDPITYLHIVDGLLSLHPERAFQSRELVEVLRAICPQMVWDSTTVGRALVDIAESLEEANEAVYLTARRRYNGMIYSVTDNLEGRQALLNLMEDLAGLSEELIDQERRGIFPKRINSPLTRCASVYAQ